MSAMVTGIWRSRNKMSFTKARCRELSAAVVRGSAHGSEAGWRCRLGARGLRVRASRLAVDPAREGGGSGFA